MQSEQRTAKITLIKIVAMFCSFLSHSKRINTKKQKREKYVSIFPSFDYTQAKMSEETTNNAHGSIVENYHFSKRQKIIGVNNIFHLWKFMMDKVC